MSSRRSADRKEVAARDRKDDNQPQRSATPDLPKKQDPADKDRINREKMIKRAEALILMKDHMRKEIEEQMKRQAEKDKQKEQEKEDREKARERAEAALEIARLEQIKKETLEKLKVQEEIKQLTAVKKVMEVVRAGVEQISRKKSSRRSKSRSRSSRSRSKSRSRRSSSSDRGSRRRRGEKRRRRHSDSSSD